MKRILSGLLVFLLMIGLLGCGSGNQTATTEGAGSAPVAAEPVVPDPMEQPVYEFDHTPTTDELRQMAVQAMHDALTVQFAVDRFYRYTKRETVGEKFYTYVPQNIYCGLPYDDAGMSLIHFYEYYDPTTGLFTFDGEDQQIDNLVGNSCAGSVTMAIATVCPSIRGFVTWKMTPYYGYVPVGPYEVPAGLINYKDYPTNLITEANGPEVMYASYAMMLPADGLSSRLDDHAMMCIEPAHVVYKDDGSIDPDQSIIVIQDQRGGTGKGYYTQTVDGVDYHYSGRTYAEYTFKELYDLGYVPVTTVEFLGQREYVEPSITFDRPDCTWDDVAQGVVSTVYPIYIARMILVDEEGNETLVDKVISRANELDITDVTVTFALSEFSVHPKSETFCSLLEEGKTYTLRYEIVLSNGSTHTAAEVEVTG